MSFSRFIFLGELCFWINTLKAFGEISWNYISAWVFFCKFAADLQNSFLKEHLWRTAPEGNSGAVLGHVWLKFTLRTKLFLEQMI